MALAIAVFLVSYIVIATERFPRHIVALLGATVLVTLGIFDLTEAFGFVDWETMGLLFGMFTLVEILRESGFFTWLANTVAHRVNYAPAAIFVAFPLLAGLMSAFMDSITVMLFLTALTLRIAKLINIDPIPLVIAEVCAANTGGASTLVGDPPNVILGTVLGFSFNDFVVNTGPAAVFSLFAIVGVFYLFNRRMLHQAKSSLNWEEIQKIDRTVLITDKRMFRTGLIGFAVAIALLVTHNGLNELLKPVGLHISTATAALLPALVTVILGGREVRHAAARIDIESLLFFIGLFILVGGLEHTGFIKLIAQGLAGVANSVQVLLMALLWGSGVASGVVDNVPMALAMAYVLRDFAAMPGAPALAIMTWALALGIDIGGNFTPVGASANVVSYTSLEKHGLHVGWPRWIRSAFVPTVTALVVSSAFVLFKHAIGWW